MKTIVITGVSRGIGKALAARFLANGDEVIGTSTSGTSEIQNPNFTVVELDLSKPESIQEAVKHITAFGKRVDILINNAGMLIEEEHSSPRIVIDYLRKTLEVNLIGTISFTEEVLLLMNEGGHLINISSRAGSLGDFQYTDNYPSYRLSKAGVNMFTRILAQRLKGKITVSSVHPGSVRTDMGYENAPLSPEEAAEDIFKLAYANVATGQFWYKDKNFPW